MMKFLVLLALDTVSATLPSIVYRNSPPNYVTTIVRDYYDPPLESFGRYTESHDPYRSNLVDFSTVTRTEEAAWMY